MTKKILLVVGLGNPGPQYQNTRHNIGFMAADLIAKMLGAGDFKSEKKFIADTATTDFHDHKIIIAKPTTFMNLSGQSVMSMSQFYKIQPQDICVIYDDIDLPLGQIRIRKSGGPGTHNGMKSITQYIGNDFPRIRIGIESRGATAPKEQDISSFVLSPFQQSEEDQVQESLQKTTQAIQTIIDDGITEAMNKINQT